MRVKTDNGWFNIEDIKPNANEEVIVILERECSYGCTYSFDVCESIYVNGQFSGENVVWKVRYWRRKEVYPYPDAIVDKEIQDCKKHGVSFQKIIEHQRKCGIHDEYV